MFINDYSVYCVKRRYCYDSNSEPNHKCWIDPADPHFLANVRSGLTIPVHPADRSLLHGYNGKISPAMWIYMNGVSIFRESWPVAHLTSSDAFCLWGCGAYLDTHWFQLGWPLEAIDQDIIMFKAGKVVLSAMVYTCVHVRVDIHVLVHHAWNTLIMQPHLLKVRLVICLILISQP